jgi:hypothetical protein
LKPRPLFAHHDQIKATNHAKVVWDAMSPAAAFEAVKSDKKQFHKPRNKMKFHTALTSPYEFEESFIIMPYYTADFYGY